MDIREIVLRPAACSSSESKNCGTIDIDANDRCAAEILTSYIGHMHLLLRELPRSTRGVRGVS